MNFEHGPGWLIRWSFSYFFLFKRWVAELYLGGQWFHYTDRGNCHSSKITRAKLAKGKCFLSHRGNHKRNTDKMSPQTQWPQDYRNLISHFINWVLSVDMANNRSLEAPIHQKYMRLSRRLFNNLFPVFFQVVKVGLGRLSDLLKGCISARFKNWRHFQGTKSTIMDRSTVML